MDTVDHALQNIALEVGTVDVFEAEKARFLVCLVLVGLNILAVDSNVCEFKSFQDLTFRTQLKRNRVIL